MLCRSRIVAIVAVLGFIACSQANTASSPPPEANAKDPPGTVTPQRTTTPQVDAGLVLAPSARGRPTGLELRDALRAAWMDDAAWTRFYVVAVTTGLAEQRETSDRLLRQQLAIRDELARFLGDAPTRRLLTELYADVDDMQAVVRAVTEQTAGDVDAARAGWSANADAIAAEVARLDGRLDGAELRALLHEHQAQVFGQVFARSLADWPGDQAAFDGDVGVVLELADAMTRGIGAKYPDKLASLASTEAGLHLAMRKAWDDEAALSRVAMLEALAQQDESRAVPVAIAALARNGQEIAAVLRPYLKLAEEDELSAMMREHAEIALEVFGAMKAGDARLLADARARWLSNADDVARVLARGTALPYDDLRTRMRAYVDGTFLEARDHRGELYQADIAADASAERDALALADRLSEAITRLVIGCPQ